MRQSKEIKADLEDLREALHNVTKATDSVYWLDLQFFADTRRDLIQELRQAEAVENCH